MNKFSIRKILQILYYIQNSILAISPSKDAIMYFLKILFFADRYHLRNYGITLSGDFYYGMKNGPVASSTYDILHHKLPNTVNSAEGQLLNEIETSGEYTVYIKPQGDDELSQSVKEALDFSLSNFGRFSQFELSDITHEYPEWKKHKDCLVNDVKRFDISFAEMFENPYNPEELKKFHISKDPFEEDEEFLSVMKETYCDANAI